MFAASKTGAPVAAKDPKFNYVTMLLHGDGTNGAQNNTFLDSSTNNFTITRNGNTTQGTFSPYGSNWSNFFDASGDYLTLPNATTLALGTSDFTVEGWFNFSSSSAAAPYYNFGLISCYENQSGSSGFTLAVSTSSNSLNVGIGDTNLLTTSFTISVGTWYHFAVSRSSGTIRLFINGTLATSASNSSNFTTSSNPTSIGSINVFGVGNTMLFNGYASNVRIVKGTAVYTSSFTPSTTPLTAVTNTALLTCQSNRFIDNSTNAYAITKNGDVSVQRFSPFSPTSAYSTSVIGGSGYFDGSGDYLTAPDNTAFDMANGDFTVELWFNPTQAKNTSLFTKRASNASYSPIMVQWTSGNQLVAFCSTTGSSWGMNSTTSATYPLNSWIHVAFVRYSNNLYLYVNGVSAVTPVSISSAVMTNTSAFVIGADDAAGNLGYAGYISNVRVVKGTAVYTAAFTPPTAPLTAITNTSLLVSYTNAGILDNAEMNDLETVGNAQISTSVKKYGTGSIALDGTGDYLNCANPASVIYQFGTGDFTVEFWAYLTNSGNDNGPIFDTRSTSGNGLLIRQGNGAQGISNRIDAVIGGSATASSGTISFNTWVFVAVVRNSGTLKVYYNGTGGTGVTATGNITGTNAYIGAFYDGLSVNIAGYFDDFRITKGYARYTSNFTPPTAAFPNN